MAQVKAMGDEGKWGELKETDKRRMLRHINGIIFSIDQDKFI